MSKAITESGLVYPRPEQGDRTKGQLVIFPHSRGCQSQLSLRLVYLINLSCDTVRVPIQL